jgi:hypothetical protein
MKPITQREIDQRVFDLYDERVNVTCRAFEQAARLAWERTVAFFRKHLAGNV